MHGRRFSACSRIKGVLILVVLLLLAISFILLTLPQASRGAVIGVYFYPWYSSLGRHWDWSVDPTWATVEKPIIGFYDSRDEHVIRWQLRLIKDVGVDFIAISWWGPGSFEDEAAKAVIKHMRDYGLKFAILIEPYLGSNNPSLYDRSFWESTLSYIRENFIEPYRDVYMHLHGKPLVLAFNPIGLSYRPHEDFPDYTIRIVGNDIDNAKYQDWDYWPDYLVSSPSTELRIRRDGMVSITPRYCDVYFRKPGVCLDPDLSQGFYRKQWDWILRNADKVKLVMITSWNEYHERTQIEPSYSNETRDPWLLYSTTREYIRLFRERRALTAILSALLLICLATGLALLVYVYSSTRGPRAKT